MSKEYGLVYTKGARTFSPDAKIRVCRESFDVNAETYMQRDLKGDTIQQKMVEVINFVIGIGWEPVGGMSLSCDGFASQSFVMEKSDA